MRADNIRRASMWAKALLLRPEHRFWLIVGLIALGGGALRVLMHDYFLPWFTAMVKRSRICAARFTG